MIKRLEDEKLEDLVKEGNVLVDFSASWCGPCQMLEPVLEELASDRSNIKVISVDVDEHEELSRKYGVMSVPTLVVYKNGKMVSRNTGYTTKDVIESWYE